MIGKASLYLSAVNSMDNSDVRISKKIMFHTVDEALGEKVGPKDGDDYVGGNYVSTLKYRQYGYFKLTRKYRFSYFIDFANVWGVDYDSSIINQIQ